MNKQALESLYHNFEIPDEQSKDKNQNWFKASLLTSKRNKVILGLIIYQGLDTAALGKLTEKDVKLRAGKIFITGTRRSNERMMKLEAHQVLDMMEYTLQVRQKILDRYNKSSESLFVSAGKSTHFRSIISKLIKKLNKQSSTESSLGVKVTSVRQLRASVIVQWLKIYNLREAQYLAGHRFVSSTEAFLVNDIDDLTEEITKYHPIG